MACQMDQDKSLKHIKIEYRDEFGRLLKPKEAYRQLSHKFHGKVPGSGRSVPENAFVTVAQILYMDLFQGPSAMKREKKLKAMREEVDFHAALYLVSHLLTAPLHVRLESSGSSMR